MNRGYFSVWDELEAADMGELFPRALEYQS